MRMVCSSRAIPTCVALHTLLALGSGLPLLAGLVLKGLGNLLLLFYCFIIYCFIVLFIYLFVFRYPPYSYSGLHLERLEVNELDFADILHMTTSLKSLKV